MSHHRLVIGWLLVRSVIQHRSLVAMHKQYRSDHCVLLDPSIEFGRQSSYYTRTPARFANIFRYHLSFSKKFFQPKVTDWWNDLPITLISSSATTFSRELYNYLSYTWFFVCFCTLLVLYLIVVVCGCFCGSCILYFCL